MNFTQALTNFTLVQARVFLGVSTPLEQKYNLWKIAHGKGYCHELL